MPAAAQSIFEHPRNTVASLNVNDDWYLELAGPDEVGPRPRQ